MAGSLNHLIAKDGSFTFDLIENMGDAHEALEECFYIIQELSGGSPRALNPILKRLGYSSISEYMLRKPNADGS